MIFANLYDLGVMTLRGFTDHCSCIWRVENGIVFYTLVSGVVSRYRWWPRDLYYQIKSPDLTKRRDRSRGRCRSREDRELVMACILVPKRGYKVQIDVFVLPKYKKHFENVPASVY